jgi:hypothetical protein
LGGLPPSDPRHWALTPVVNVVSMNAALVTIAERRIGELSL